MTGAINPTNEESAVGRDHDCTVCIIVIVSLIPIQDFEEP